MHTKSSKISQKRRIYSAKVCLQNAYPEITKREKTVLNEINSFILSN